MAKSATRGTLVTSWWLSDGDEECPHCGRLYVYETQVRCTECDGPGCPHCAVVEGSGQLICVACAPARSAGG